VSKERIRIAIIDDESDLAELFSQGLQSAGLNAISFYDPIGALEYIAAKQHEFSLVITDWKMPKMNGLELTKKMYDIDAGIRVMLMSAYELDEEQLREIGKEEYLRKPMKFVQSVIEPIGRFLL
jgi:DNA-binding response OmpR family regulator